MNTLFSILFLIAMTVFALAIFILAEHKEEVWNKIFFGDDENGDL